MKLGDIYGGFPVLGKIAQIKMNPKRSYLILKYFRILGQEYEMIEKQRVALIHEITRTNDGEEASVKSGSPEFASYVEKFSAVLEVESDIAICALTMDALLEEISDGLTMQEVGALEPLFTA